MKELLNIDHLTYSYHSLKGETLAIEDMSCHVKEGEFVAFVGPSGCGKSTLLSLIAGLIEPGSGNITINGCDSKNSCKNIGYMLQSDNLLEWRSTLKNVELGLEIQNKLTDSTIVISF